MKLLARIAVLALAFLGMAVPAARAAALETQAPQYAQEELDSLLAPIALYPDELLAQILMAATYPLEVAQAARWSRTHPELNGDEAVRAVDDRDWDPSVKSLVAFPDVLAMMDERLEWTQRLGETFLGDQQAAMDTVQRLRRVAYERGNLRSSDEVVVQREGEEILIEPPTPDTVYVPYYDPRVVYGDWWAPDYPPVYWSPWPGYAYAGYGWGWGLGVPVGFGFFYGGFDWHRHNVHVGHHRPFYYHRDHEARNPLGRDWRHDPRHRQGVGYRDPALHQRYAGANGNGSWSRDRDGRRQRPSGTSAPPATQGTARAPAPQVAPAAPAATLARPNAQGFFPQPSPPRAQPQPSAPQHQYVPAQPLQRPAPPQYVPAQPLQRPAPPQYVPAQPLQRAAPAQQLAPPPPRYVAPQPMQHVAPAPAPSQPLARPQPVAPMPQQHAPAPQPAPAPSAPADRGVPARDR